MTTSILFEQTLPLELCVISCPRGRPSLGLVAAPGAIAALGKLRDLLSEYRSKYQVARRGSFKPVTPLPVSLLADPEGEILTRGILVVRFVTDEDGAPALDLRAMDENGERALTDLESRLQNTHIERKAYRRGQEHGGRVDGLRVVSILERRGHRAAAS